MIWKYPQEVHDLVKKWATEMPDAELAELVNRELGTEFTASSMKAFRGNYGYRNGRRTWRTSEEYWKLQKRYPHGMYEYIRDNSWGVSSKEMAERVNVMYGTAFTQTMMKQFRQRHGIKSGCTGWYQKGHPPGNKGKKLEEYVGPDRAAEIRQRISATQFKKGERPVNELPLGTIVVNSDGYKLLKISMTGSLWERWIFLHRAVWINYHGDIPDGMIVSFKDSNTLNCDPENLMLISKAENSVLNRCGLRFDDPDLTETGLAVAKLKIASKKRRRE